MSLQHQQQEPSKNPPASWSQFNYVFSIEPDEAALFDVVEPQLVQASKGVRHAEAFPAQGRDSGRRLPPQLTDVVYVDPSTMYRGEIPWISIFLNQQNGQLNVQLATAGEIAPVPVEATHHLSRTPALHRMDSQIRDIATVLNQSRSVLEKLEGEPPIEADHGSPPQPRSRQTILSPAGVAIRTPDGSKFLPIGSMRSPGGTVWTPKGSMYSPGGGTFFWPPNTLVADDGTAVTPAGTCYHSPDKNGYGPAGHIYTSNGSRISPNGSIQAPWIEYQSYVKTKRPTTARIVRSIRQPGRPSISISTIDHQPLAPASQRRSSNQNSSQISKRSDLTTAVPQNDKGVGRPKQSLNNSSKSSFNLPKKIEPRIPAPRELALSNIT